MCSQYQKLLGDFQALQRVKEELEEENEELRGVFMMVDPNSCGFHTPSDFTRPVFLFSADLEPFTQEFFDQLANLKHRHHEAVLKVLMSALLLLLPPIFVIRPLDPLLPPFRSKPISRNLKNLAQSFRMCKSHLHRLPLLPPLFAPRPPPCDARRNWVIDRVIN